MHIFFLYTDAFTHRGFYAKKEVFTHRCFVRRCFCAHKSRHIGVFTHRTLSTEKPLHRTVFAHVFFTQRNIWHRETCTHRLHTEVFTDRLFCMQKFYPVHSIFFRTEAFTHQKTYAQQFLQTDGFLHTETSLHRSLAHKVSRTAFFTHRHKLHTETCAHSTRLHIANFCTERLCFPFLITYLSCSPSQVIVCIKQYIYIYDIIWYNMHVGAIFRMDQTWSNWWTIRRWFDWVVLKDMLLSSNGK